MVVSHPHPHGPKRDPDAPAPPDRVELAFRVCRALAGAEDQARAMGVDPSSAWACLAPIFEDARKALGKGGAP